MKYKNVCQMCRATNGFVKKASIKQKKKMRKILVDEQETEWKNRYTEEQKKDAKFGIFYKKGYVSIKIFNSKEDAENYLKSFRKPEYYDIREIIEWGEV